MNHCIYIYIYSTPKSLIFKESFKNDICLIDVKLYIGAKRNPENGSFYWVNSNTEYLEEVNQSQPLFQFLNTGTENNDNSSCLAVFFQSSMMVERVNCAANYSALCEISKGKAK